jgi:hypothetical protein
MTTVEPQTEQPPPVKKRKRVFMWVFLAIQVLFLIWVIAGAASGHHVSAADCAGLDTQTCQSAADAGTTIGVGLVIAFWAVVDVILGVTYAVVRLARRQP